VRDGQELLLADTPDDFAAAVLRLINDAHSDAPLTQALGAAARQFVEERYGWETIIPQFDQLYQRVKGA
jgi:glycosyltransferase involved in cell wall biosynthesis